LFVSHNILQVIKNSINKKQAIHYSVTLGNFVHAHSI